MTNPNLSVTVADGKYTLVFTPDGHLSALRYGQPWRDLTGDGMVLALVQEVDKLRAALISVYDARPSQRWQAERIEAALGSKGNPTAT